MEDKTAWVRFSELVHSSVKSVVHAGRASDVPKQNLDATSEI